MKWITDIHNHSEYSFDSQTPLKEMVESAVQKGVAFYGMAEHFDYDLEVQTGDFSHAIDEAAYFREARRLQEDYAGAINLLVGAELSYADDERVHALCRSVYETYRPDFIVNSIHTLRGKDYYYQSVYYTGHDKGEKKLREKGETYREYLALVRKSLDAPYPYDIVGHIGYAARYAPYEDREMRYLDHAEQIDDILLTIVRKDKILEVNGGNKGLAGVSVPSREIVERYYALGGRKISYGADAHEPSQQQRNREEIVKMLKEIGFTHVTVPCRGEHIEVEL